MNILENFKTMKPKHAGITGLVVGVTAFSLLFFVWPGNYRSKSGAEESEKTAVAAVHTKYCLNSYLGSGVSVADATALRGKSTVDQATALVAGRHVLDEEGGKACGQALDQLRDEATLAAAIKKATSAKAASVAAKQ